MEKNPIWLVPLLYAVAGVATVGGTWWGVRELRAYQQEGEEQVRQQQAAQAAAQAQQTAQMRQLLNQIQPVMVAGTVVMTGLGTAIMLRGIRRDRRRKLRRRRERVE